jgi:ParB-like chromosome segregation protein Spo0J
MKIADIKPYPHNPRKNDNVKEVKESIEKFGYISPLVIDENNVILAGHSRYFALLELGYEDIDVVKVEHLSEEKKSKFRILDNKLNELSKWDLNLVEVELRYIDDDDAAMITPHFSFPKIGEAKSDENWQASYERLMAQKAEDLEEQYDLRNQATSIQCPSCQKNFDVIL